ncbi:MAG: hypothetical protein U0X40_02505 [Ferruginibacter sp.]
MKFLWSSLTCFLLLAACSQSDEHPVPALSKQEKDSIARAMASQRFFPVTNFLKGQLIDLAQKGVTPLKYNTVGEHTDSVWLTNEELPLLLAPFFEPVIDSTNLISLFAEKKFMDQTLNAVTFSYEPAGPMPDSLHLSRWDVYVDPETQKVKRVFMIKQPDKTTTLQLTWVSNKWCKITTLRNKPDGSSVVEKEEKISWDY